MKTTALICILLVALFTVQPLVMMNAHAAVTHQTKNTGKSCCKKEVAANTENKNCDATNRCNTSSCCFSCQYLPIEQTIDKQHLLSYQVKLHPYYSENLVTGYATDSWQPPEFFFI